MSLLAAAIPAAIGAVGSAVNSKKAKKYADDARTDARKAMKTQFVDLRKAAEKGGFNPLTALQATGGAGFGASSVPFSAPPLATSDFMLNALSSLAVELTSPEEQGKTADRFNTELAEVQNQQAAGGINPSNNAPQESVAPSLSIPLARASLTTATEAAKDGPTVPIVTEAAMGKWMDPDRPVEQDPIADTPGSFLVSNSLTDKMGGAIPLIGDAGEPWGWSELSSAGFQGGMVGAYRLGDWAADQTVAALSRKRNSATQEKINAQNRRWHGLAPLAGELDYVMP